MLVSDPQWINGRSLSLTAFECQQDSHQVEVANLTLNTSPLSFRFWFATERVALAKCHPSCGNLFDMVHPVFAVSWKLVSLVVCQYSAAQSLLIHHVFLDRPVADVWQTL